MTTTHDSPAGETVRIDPVADKPTNCPPWCRGHKADYADDFGTFKSREDMATALRDWRKHNRYIADVTLWTLWTLCPTIIEGYAPSWVERADTQSYSLTLESSEKPGVTLTPVNLSFGPSCTEIQMTGAEARQLAAYLIRAADLADRDEDDR